MSKDRQGILIFFFAYAKIDTKRRKASKKEIIMANQTLTAAYEGLPKIAKILIQIFLGALVGGVYRILRFLEPKNIVTLVAGILNFFGVGLIFWVVDLVTEITADRITVLAD